MNDLISGGIRYNMECGYNMRIFRIYSYKYNIDIAKLIKRRFNAAGMNYSILKSTEQAVEIGITDDEPELFCRALCEILLSDIMQFELADIIRGIPTSLEIKREILMRAVSYAYKAAVRTPVRQALCEYFSDNDSLVLEGFITFRMPDTLEIWERCVEKAAEDCLLTVQQEELAQLICDLVSLCPESIKEVIVIVRKDGSCTVVDEDDNHIDYPCSAYDSVMSILLTLDPERILIYDMTGNTEGELISSLKSVFSGRVRVYSTV